MNTTLKKYISCSIVFILINIFCTTFAFAGDLLLEPYAGFNYGLSFRRPDGSDGIDYTRFSPQWFNSLGGTIGVKSDKMMIELNGLYSANSKRIGGEEYGVISATSRLISFRLSGLFSIYDFYNKGSILLIVGVLHATESVSLETKTTLNPAVKRDAFGMMIEAGIGYLYPMNDNIEIGRAHV